jgi:DNA-binding winged helix-turn-helix (wHTH) protein
MEKTPFRTYRFDEFQLDLKRCRLLNGRLEVRELTPKAFEVLKYLCANPKRLIKRAELLKVVWPGVIVSEGSPKECIWEIRRALGDKGKEIIVTRHGLGGWIFECDVREADQETPPRIVSADLSDEVNSIQEPHDDLVQSEDLPHEPRTDPVNIAAVTATEKETENEPTSAAELHAERPPSPDYIPGEQGLQEGRINQRSVRDDFDGASNGRNETFERWLSRTPGSLIALILLVCIGTTVVLSIVIAVNGEAHSDAQAAHSNAQAMSIASGAQCLVILLMFLHSQFWMKALGFRPNEKCKEADIVKAGFKNQEEFEKNRASLESNLKRYSWWWRGLLLSWVPLYIVFALGDFPHYRVFLVIFNLGNTFMLGACFYALNKKVDEQDVDEQDSEHFAGGILNIAILFILAVVLVTLLFTENLAGATLLTGILAGITMALVVGRLSSRFLSPRFWILYLLYSYTAIQPLVLYIEGHPGWGLIILDFALLLKCLLYVYMAWLFQSGLLLFYFASVNRTDNALREQRKAFQKLI